jgi:glutathione S-transferase
MIYLADASPEAGLAPDIDDAARPDFLRWMTFFAATTYPTMMRFFHPDNYIDDESQFDAVKAFGARDAAKQWSMVETALAENGYLAGGRMSAADIYFLMFAVWGEESFPPWFERFPHTKRLHDELIGRPAIAGILERHQTGAWSD